MVQRIEVVSRILDAREQIKKKHLEESGFSGRIDDVKITKDLPNYRREV